MWGLLFLAASSLVLGAHERILLKDIQVLTLRNGAFTTGRRNSPIPQLQCQNCHDDAARKVVDTIQCRNVGFDGRDVNWKCETEIDKHWKLGRTEVSCEGYESPDDPFVLAGSCAIEYHLIHTPPQPTHRPQVQQHKTVYGSGGSTRYQEPTFRTISKEDVVVQPTYPTSEYVALVIVILGTLAICAATVLCCIWCDKHTPSVNYVHIPQASPAYPTVHVPPSPIYMPGYYAPSPPPPVVVHRTTTTVVRERSPSPTPSAPAREPSPEKHVSTSYATTKRR